MRKFDETDALLTRLGQRLHAARLDRNESMALFAERLGVSEGTIRAMERGMPTVQVGVWLNAFWLLDRLHELEGVLEPGESLLERARAKRAPHRQRASRRQR